MWLDAKSIKVKKFNFMQKNIVIFQKFITLNITLPPTNLALDSFLFFLITPTGIFVNFLFKSFSKRNYIRPFSSKHLIRSLTLALKFLVMNKRFYLLI
jgi:hypothetical protein